MITLKVLSVQKIDIQADNSTMLDVEFSFLDGEQTLETRRQNFPLDTTPDGMKQALQDVLSAYVSDRDLAVKNAVLEAAQKTADETIAALQGFELSADTVSQPPAEQPAATPDPVPADQPADQQPQA